MVPGGCVRKLPPGRNVVHTGGCVRKLPRGRNVVHTGGKGSLTQWVHCEFVVSFEAIRPVITQQVCGEFF